MSLLDKKSALWAYLSDDLKGLLVDGELLVAHAEDTPHKVSDFSYLVFPFSKAYEGFLKKLFLDLRLIKEDEFYGDEIRIGRILNPHFMDDHGNVFQKLCSSNENQEDFANRLWELWHRGRNRVFHYFPHNFRKLSYDEALGIIEDLLDAMEDTIVNCYLKGNVS